MCVFNCSDLLYLEVAATRHIVIPREQTGMLVVSLRGVNFGFWSRLGCSKQSANILCRQGLV